MALDELTPLGKRIKALSNVAADIKFCGDELEEMNRISKALTTTATGTILCELRLYHLNSNTDVKIELSKSDSIKHLRAAQAKMKADLDGHRLQLATLAAELMTETAK